MHPHALPVVRLYQCSDIETLYTSVYNHGAMTPHSRIDINAAVHARPQTPRVDDCHSSFLCARKCFIRLTTTRLDRATKYQNLSTSSSSPLPEQGSTLNQSSPRRVLCFKRAKRTSSMPTPLFRWPRKHETYFGFYPAAKHSPPIQNQTAYCLNKSTSIVVFTTKLERNSEMGQS